MRAHLSACPFAISIRKTNGRISTKFGIENLLKN